MINIRNIKDDLKNSKIVFLAGSGISYETPSNVETADQISEEILSHFFPIGEKKLREYSSLLKNCRFESIISKYIKYFDDKMKIYDYFAEKTNYNILHTFLADQIIKKKIVLTTNIDTLIERALLNIFKKKKEKCISIITEDDFINYSNPIETIGRDFYPIYKLHGSSLDVFKEDSKKRTAEIRDKIQISIENILKGKNINENPFIIKSFQQKLFENLENALIVVLGYSGSDDLDIIQTICNIKNLKGIVWINHDEEKKSFDENSIIQFNYNSKNQAISEHLRNIFSLIDTKILYVNMNTKVFLTEMFEFPDLMINQKDIAITQPNFKQWLEKNFQLQENWEKSKFFGALLMELSSFEKALEFFEYALKYFESSKEILEKNCNLWEYVDLMRIKASILKKVEKFGKIKRILDKSLHLLDERNKKLNNVEKIRFSNLKNKIMNDIAYIYYKLGETEKARKILRDTLKYNEIMHDIEGIGVNSLNLAKFEYESTNYEEFDRLMKNALKFYEKIGDPRHLLLYFNNKLDYYLEIKDNQEIKNIIGKLQLLHSHIGNLENQGSYQAILAKYEHYRKNFDVALEYCQKALKIFEILNNKSKLSNIYNLMGLVYLDYKEKIPSNQKIFENFEKGIAYIEKSLKMKKELNDKQSYSSTLLNLGLFYMRYGQLKGLDCFKEVNQIGLETQNNHIRANAKLNAAIIFKFKKKFNIARNYLIDALELIKNSRKPLKNVINKELEELDAIIEFNKNK